jgi:YYY domain-containing protein
VLLVVGLALNLLSYKREASSQKSKVGDEAELEAVLQQPAAISYQLGAVSSQGTVILVDKLWDRVRQAWFDLLEAVGGRVAFLLYAVCLGGLSFLNTWDFPIYLSVVGLAFIVWSAQQVKDEGGRWKVETFILQGVVGTAILGLVGVLLYLPFYATFQSQAKGILPNLWNPTRLPQFFVFFGPFLVAAIMFLVVLSSRERVWRKYIGSTLPLTILGPVLVMLLVLSGVLLSPAGRDYVQGFLADPAVQQVLGEATVGSLVQASLWRRLVNPWTFVFVGGLLGWGLALFVGRLGGWKAEEGESSAAEQFVLILVMVGLALPLAVEFIYLRDNFGIRMNTIFKFYFQAWVLLALASAFAVYYVSKHLRGAAGLAWQMSMVLLVAGGLVYPVLATPNKADYFKSPPTLNAIAWIAEYRPGDYAAIEWLRANASNQAVILEAPGAPAGQYGSYNYSGRISAMTGLPTLLGWGGHQSQWRGNYDEPARREPDIALLYNSSDIRRTQALLDKYGISYVIVGTTEQERYSPQGLKKFEQFMAVAFQQGDTIIYQRR